MYWECSSAPSITISSFFGCVGDARYLQSTHGILGPRVYCRVVSSHGDETTSIAHPSCPNSKSKAPPMRLLRSDEAGARCIPDAHKRRVASSSTRHHNVAADLASPTCVQRPPGTQETGPAAPAAAAATPGVDAYAAWRCGSGFLSALMHGRVFVFRTSACCWACVCLAILGHGRPCAGRLPGPHVSHADTRYGLRSARRSVMCVCGAEKVTSWSLRVDGFGGCIASGGRGALGLG